MYAYLESLQHWFIIGGYNEDFSSYSKYEFSCELANISEDFIYSDLDITSKNTGKQISVTVKNNSKEVLSGIDIVIAYYKNDVIVGIKDGYSNETINPDSNAYINVEYPEDNRYKPVSFDRYEVHYINASKY